MPEGRNTSSARDIPLSLRVDDTSSGEDEGAHSNRGLRTRNLPCRSWRPIPDGQPVPTGAESFDRLDTWGRRENIALSRTGAATAADIDRAADDAGARQPAPRELCWSRSLSGVTVLPTT